MSTSAVVFVKNEKGTYTGTEIGNDGYIDDSDARGRCHGFGAGYFLGKYWNDREDVKKLVNSNAVRNLGESIEETEFYDWRQHGLDNLTMKDIKNLGYNYIYVFNQDDEWMVMNTCYDRTANMFFNLNSFLDYDDPERFYDNETFWE